MALRDTTWITDTHFLETKHVASQEVLTIAFGTSITRRRTRTIVDGEWVSLTEAAATAYADSHAGDTNATFAAIEDNRFCGAWKLTSHVDSKGAWATDT